jgi:20S proteasome alpha/beta subunit
VDEAIKFSINALKKLLADTFNFDRIDVAYISNSDKKFVKMTKKDIEKIFSQSKKK